MLFLDSTLNLVPLLSDLLFLLLLQTPDFFQSNFLHELLLPFEDILHMLLPLSLLLIEDMDKPKGLLSLALFLLFSHVMDVHVIVPHLQLLFSEDVLAVLILKFLCALSSFITLLVFPLLLALFALVAAR